MRESWIKCHRTEESLQLATKPEAFMLLWQIAYRAQRKGTFNLHNLKVGEAFLGDYKNLGMTQGQYRQAKKFLQKHGFATFMGTNKGTIATLTDITVFDLNLEHQNEQGHTPATNGQRTSNEPTTTTKNVKNDKNEKNIREGRRKAEKGTCELSLPGRLDSEAFMRTWLEWMEYRRTHPAPIANEQPFFQKQLDWLAGSIAGRQPKSLR